MSINKCWIGLSRRYGGLALLVVMMCVLISGHGRVDAADDLIFWGDNTFIVDGVRGRAFVAATVPDNGYRSIPKIVVIDTETGAVQNSDFFPLLGTSPAAIAFDHQRNWLLIDELTRITVINASSGEQIYQLEGTFDEGDSAIGRPQIDSSLGVAWLFRSGSPSGSGDEPNTQPARVITMNLLNGAHIQERVQPIEKCCFRDEDDGLTYSETASFGRTFYDPTTKQLHYTYGTSFSWSTIMGVSETFQLVTLDAQSLGKVGETPIPHIEGDATRGFDAVPFNGRLHGVSSGHHKVEGWPAASWVWQNGNTMTTYPNERSRELGTSNSTSKGMVIDIQRGLLVEIDGVHIFIREAGSRNIIGVVDMTAFVEQTSVLMGHDPITDHLIFLDWENLDEGRNRSFFVRSMADLIAMSRPWQNPDASDGGGDTAAPPTHDNDCTIPESGVWPSCATGGGNNMPSQPEDRGDCVIPESGKWPQCAIGVPY